MITRHAMDRINGRMAQIGMTVSAKHLDALSKARPNGKHYVRIAELSAWMYTPDGSNGDCLTAIVNDGRIVTVMLSGSKQRWADGTFSVALQRDAVHSPSVR